MTRRMGESSRRKCVYRIFAGGTANLTVVESPFHVVAPSPLIGNSFSVSNLKNSACYRSRTSPKQFERLISSNPFVPPTHLSFESRYLQS